MKISNDNMKVIMDALGGFIWLGNNIQNFYSPEFRNMFLAGVEDAKKAYQICLDYGVHTSKTK